MVALIRPILRPEHILLSSLEKEVLRDIYQGLRNFPVSPLVDCLNINEELLPVLYGLNFMHMRRHKYHDLLQEDMQYVMNIAHSLGRRRIMPWREQPRNREEMDLLNPYPSNTRRQRRAICRYELENHILTRFEKDPIKLQSSRRNHNNRLRAGLPSEMCTVRTAQGFASRIADYWSSFSRNIPYPTRLIQHELF